MPAVGLDRPVVQQDFSGGMFRGVREDLIPQNGAYDILNGLLDNDGSVYRRGGSTYRSTAPFGAWIPFIWDGFLTGGVQRTLIASTTAFGVLNGDGTVTNLGGAGVPRPQRAAALGGVLYMPGGITYNGTVLGVAPQVATYYATTANRLFAATGDTIRFSDINATGGATTTFNLDDFHQVPEGVQVIGLEGLRNALVAFTTGGVWVYSNLGYDLVDANGNVQHRVDRYSRDLVLWGDAGIAAWEGGLVVPALDAVWVMALGVASEAPSPFQRISDAIQVLYRDYVRRGFSPGQACVYRGHYLLPIMDGPNTVDVLVCRLDHPARPWSHLAGFGARVAALTIRTSSAQPRQPVLIGASSAAGRVLNLGWFDPGEDVARDADATAGLFSVQARDYATGSLNRNTITRLRMAYDMTIPASAGEAVAAGPTTWGAFDWGRADWAAVATPSTIPKITASILFGRSLPGGTEWGRFSWGQASWAGVVDQAPLSGAAGEDRYGYEPYTWYLAERERFGRFRIQCAEPTSRLTLRRLEMFVRSSGRI